MCKYEVKVCKCSQGLATVEIPHEGWAADQQGEVKYFFSFWAWWCFCGCDMLNLHSKHLDCTSFVPNCINIKNVGISCDRRSIVLSGSRSCPCVAVMTSYLLLLTKWMTRYIPPTLNWASQVPASPSEMAFTAAYVLLFLQMLQWLLESCFIWTFKFRYSTFFIYTKIIFFQT